jgi:microsomal dipeptidase-like Zn-dependent dipeptidase
LFEAAICGIEPRDFARAARYVADLVGVAHVALGSDFDGTVHMQYDVTGLPLMTQGLLEAGFSDQDVRQIMGGNVIRLLQDNLPPLLRDVGDQHAAVGAVDKL